MEDSFELPVTYNNKEYNFPATFISTGYTYKIQVDVLGELVNFEPDEERNFRAILVDTESASAGKTDKQLIASIANALLIIFK